MSAKLYFTRHGDIAPDLPLQLHPFIPKTITTFIPRRDKYTEKLYNYIDNINNTILEHINNTHKFYDPVDNHIVQTLYQLNKNKNIVIKPADKNLGLVILNSKDYENMCMEHLTNDTIYSEVTNIYTNLTTIIWNNLRNILKSENVLHSNNQSKNIHDIARSLMQLRDSDTLRIPPFYCLPKVHKTLIAPIPGRPIISAPSSITYHTSVFLHNLLLPLMKMLPTICMSSKQILLDIKSLPTLPETAIILTADVRSLYPSIPIDAGIIAIKTIMQQYNYMPNYQNLILKLLSFVLENNFCIFNKKIFHQKTGTAMGTPVAPTFAQIFMFYVEQHIMHTSIFYKRYIDDIFAIFVNTELAKEFITNFNSKYSTLQLESIHYEKIGVFLDIQFEIREEKIIHRLFQKPTSKFSYIPIQSSHHPAVFSSFIHEEIRRYRRVCSIDEDFYNCCALFLERLKKRGYPIQLFYKEYRKIIKPDDAFGILNRENVKNKIYLISTLPTMRESIMWNKILEFPNHLLEDPVFRVAFGDTEPRIAKANILSIKKIIVKSSYHS